MAVTSEGVIEPACNNCKTSDCENPIEKVNVSIFGENKKYRCFVSGSNISMVVSCEGYIG